MATTDRDSGGPGTLGAAATIEAGRVCEEQSSGRQSRGPTLPSWWWIGTVLVGVSGAGMIAGLYGVPWAANQGHHGVMMARTWLFLISTIVWVFASFAVIWWLTQDTVRQLWRSVKSIVRLSPKVRADAVGR